MLEPITRLYNQLDDITFTSLDIENDILNSETQVDKYKNTFVEKTLQMPMFIITFYKFCKYEHRIPTQAEFVERYFSDPDNTWFLINYNRSIQDIQHGVIARLWRTYFSLVRDIHCCLKLKEMNLFTVVYSIKADSNGIDIVIVNNNNVFGFNLFVETIQSRQWREAKLYRHNDVTINFPVFDIPMEFDRDYIVNNVFLYGERHIAQILEHVR